MLKEIRGIRQIPGEPKRRWFSSETLDLIVWYDSREQPVEFQLCYDLGGKERALTWRSPSSFAHTGVDNGESRANRNKGTPILVADGKFDPGNVARKFRDDAREIPAEITGLVLEKIGLYETKSR